MSTKLEDYDVMGIIGSGSFGTCYKVRSKLTDEYFVWKAIDYGKLTEDKKQLLVAEVNLLSELDHPNIVKYYNRILHKETTTLYIIMEWCQGGDLLSVIRQAKKSGTWLEERFIWQTMYQTGRALQACHTQLKSVIVLHRDIKPANIFLDREGNVKLGDFGLARVLEGDNAYSQTVVGTPYYMSPEVVKGAKYNRKSDIWALGCLIYELCALAPPFDGSDIHHLASNIKLGRYNRIPDHYSENLVKIIKLMLTVQHEFRPTIEMILHHPVVVANISKSAPKPLKSEPQPNTANGIIKLMKYINLEEREPEEVSENKFKEKWLIRLESLRQREAKVREREHLLEMKERSIVRKERQIQLMERMAREKISRAEVYLHQCKNNGHSVVRPLPAQTSKICRDDVDSSFSADPGDTSIVPTTAKVNTELLPRPSFVRSLSERKQKQVHFDRNVKPLRSDAGSNVVQTTKLSSSSSSSNERLQKENRAVWIDGKYATVKKAKPQRSEQDKENKLNRPNHTRTNPARIITNIIL